MSQNMYGVPTRTYAPLGGRQYYAAAVTGLITAVDDGDVGEMIRMGCVGQAIAIAAGALSAVTSVDSRTGDVVLARADISGLGTAAALNLIAGFSKRALVAGAGAGNVTVTGIKTTDTLNAVLRFIGAGTAITDVTDLTSEFTITALNTINNTSGTASTGDKLLVQWTATT